MDRRRSLAPRRLVAHVVYVGVARQLPWSTRPGGRVGRRLRRWCAERMLDRCGPQVNVEHGAWFGSGKGIELGARSDLGMDALVMGPLTVGDDVMMGPRCVLVASSHRTNDLSRPMNQQGFEADRRVVIGDDVWIGAGVTILPGRTLHRGCVVGAGAVVNRDVPPYSVVVGNPAVVVGLRSEAAVIVGDIPSSHS